MKEKPGSLSEKEKDHIKKRQKITKKEKEPVMPSDEEVVDVAFGEKEA